MVRNPSPGPDGKEVSMVGVDCSIIMNPKVWVASGHATGFADPMVDCKECKARFRADQVIVIDAYRGDTYVTSGSVEASSANDPSVEEYRRRAEFVDAVTGGHTTDPELKKGAKQFRQMLRNAVIHNQNLINTLVELAGGGVTRDEIPELLKRIQLIARP